jgi:hypothetical protein
MSWSNVHLPSGWHLNWTKVPTPPSSREGPGRRLDIHSRQLPQDLRHNPAYDPNSLMWDRWLE